MDHFTVHADDVTRTSSTTAVDVPIVVDPALGRLPGQIVDGFRDLVTRGALRPGDRLPSSRRLAAGWNISRGTVLTAWDQLAAEGYLAAAHGSGTVVNPDLSLVHPAARPHPPTPISRPSTTARPAATAGVDLRPGRPGVTGLADATWRQAWRRAAAHPSPSSVPAPGLPGLRAEIAAHLRQMRGLVVDPDEIVVTGGARDALAALLQIITVRLGHPPRVAVEDPGYPSLRRVLHRYGAAVVEIPVDDDGLSVTALEELAHPAHLVLVTPSHQYPLGASLPVGRRLRLLDWARRTDALVIEDDYDSELRYVGAPLPALAALDRGPRSPRGERVVTLGSFAKTMTPDLGTGFAVLPATLLPEMVALRSDLGPAPAPIVQRALADYLAAGGLRRHAQRMRREYRRRRSLLADAFTDVEAVRVLAMDGGLHAVLELVRTADPASAAAVESAVQHQLLAVDVQVGALGDYWASSRPRDRFGWVLGYSGVSDDDLLRGLELVRSRLDQLVAQAVPSGAASH